MARTSKEKDSTYNKAYYERLKADPERLVKRKRKSVVRTVQKNYEGRVKKWEQVLSSVREMQASDKTDHEIAEKLAVEFTLSRTRKSKWIDFSPLSSKSLSSSLSSSSAARPARTETKRRAIPALPYMEFPIVPSEDLEMEGYKCFIRNNEGINTTAYVQIPRGNRFYTGIAGSYSSSYPDFHDLDVSGGVTFYSYVPKGCDLPEGCYVGWDYAHAHDLGRKLTREEVVEDIKKAVESVKKGTQEDN